MTDILNISFQTLGNASKEDYKGSFADYCYKYLPESQKLSKSELENYYQKYEPTYKTYLCYGIIRSFLSRPLEVYLNLDRCLFLEQNNYDVQIEEVFNRELSPRNIALTATSMES